MKAYGIYTFTLSNGRIYSVNHSTIEGAFEALQKAKVFNAPWSAVRKYSFKQIKLN